MLKKIIVSHGGGDGDNTVNSEYENHIKDGSDKSYDKKSQSNKDDSSGDGNGGFSDIEENSKSRSVNYCGRSDGEEKDVVLVLEVVVVVMVVIVNVMDVVMVSCIYSGGASQP